MPGELLTIRDDPVKHPLLSETFPDLPEWITLSLVFSWYFEHNIYRAQEKAQMEAYIPHVQMFKKL